MNILAFDTSTSACSVALQCGSNVKLKHENAPMAQAKRVLDLIKVLLEESSLTFNDLNLIAYGSGPGSFTGIRIASSVAQGIGLVKPIPIIPISTLAILAQTAYLKYQACHILTAMDARMGQVYFATYQINEKGIAQICGEEQVCLPEAINMPQAFENWYGVSDGWGQYKEKLLSVIKATSLGIDASLLPKADAIIPLAQLKYEQKHWVNASLAHPTYLR